MSPPSLSEQFTPPGSYSNAEAKKYLPCNVREIAPFGGMARCLPCDSNSVSNEVFTECVCNPGRTLCFRFPPVRDSNL
jgi:hypothetical protein